MRAYMESLFYIIYLALIISIGGYLLVKGKNNKAFVLFGLACIILGFGDAWHLVPRAVGLFSKTLDEPSATLAMWLGIGKLITSITMSVFYLLLYYFIYFKISLKRNLIIDIFVYILLTARIILLALPQNGWLINDNNLLWGIVRNIPFVILGVLIIVLCFKYLRQANHYKLLYLAITLSFAFYLPVVIWAETYSWVGLLMLPKTICYLWIGIMAFIDIKDNQEQKKH